MTEVTVPAAFMFAYAITRSCMPLKGMYRTIALTPLLAPFIVSYFAGGTLNLDVAQLVIRLLAILGGAFVTARLLRWWLGNERIAANKGSVRGSGAISRK